MVFRRGQVGLRQFNTSVGNVRLAGCHGPNKFPDAGFIFNIHFRCELLLFVRVGQANGCVELLELSGVSREGSWTGFSEMDLVEPRLEVFGTKFVDVGMAIDFDVVLCLRDINSIEHVQQALAFQGD